MAVDPYQPCPCGSGKKIKFCCHDLIGEMEKIYRMIEGDQPRAALRHVEQTLAKFPARPSLLDLKITLQLSLQQDEEAKGTIQEFLASDLKSPVAHAFDAMVKADSGDVAEAMAALQNALDRCEELVPRRLADAMTNVAGALLERGDSFAARNLLWLLDDITAVDDGRALQAIKQIDKNLNIPQLLRDRYLLRSLPKDHSATAEMDRLNVLGDNGRWRAAADLCDEILPDHLDEPLFIYNRALLSGYLGDTKNCVAGLRLYARQDIPLGDAIVAEALALMLDPTSASATARVGVVRQILDEEAFHQRLASHPHAVESPLPPRHPDSAGPPPQKVYTILDRPLPEGVESLTIDQIPRHLLTLILYGRQTDNPERIAIFGALERELSQRMEVLESILGDALGEELSRDTDTGGGMTLDDPTDDLYFPRDTPREEHARLSGEARQEYIRQWPNTAHPLLGGTTPREAMDEPDLQLPAMACLLVMTQGFDTDWHAEELGDAKRELGWPTIESIDGTKTDLDTLPLASLDRLDLSIPATDQLFRYHRRAIVAQHAPVLRRIAIELLSRGDIDKPTKNALQTELIFAERSLEQSMIRLDQARAESSAAGDSLVAWDLVEFRLNIFYGNLERVYELLQYLHQEYPHEPEVVKTIQEFLMMMGAYSQTHHDHDHDHDHHHHDELLPAGEPAGRIWTPGGDSPSAPGGSKIWTPD